MDAPDTVIFDLDGTLADTSGDLIAAANAALDRFGHPALLMRGHDDAVAVRGGRAMLRIAFERLGKTEAEAEIDAAYPILLQAYGEAIDRHTVLYPGAVDAVDSLRAAGRRVGICTNKPEALAELLLKRLGVRDLFHALIGADTLPVRKPDPEPYQEAVRRAGGNLARSLLVGDTETDRRTASAAGVPCILVAFGPAGQAVHDLSPEAVITHFDDLGPAVARLLGAGN